MSGFQPILCKTEDMILDWILYGLIIWGLATLLNKTAFKIAPASRGAAWGLTILIFFINIAALSAVKVFRYQVISESVGQSISPSNPLDMSGAFVFTYSFYLSENKTGDKRVGIMKLITFGFTKQHFRVLTIMLRQGIRTFNRC